MEEVSIIGVGSYVPEKVVSNDELSKLVDTSDEWISTRTGIKQRRISEGETTSDMATKAALRALEDSGVSAEEIDLIIVATITPDNFTPATACEVQARIGAVNASAFDISAACSGYIYAMNVATQFIKTGQNKTALVIASEVMSKILDWNDRSTCVLFGDGAGAAVLKKSNAKGIISIYAGSDGRQGEALKCPATAVDNPYVKEKNIVNSVITMDGREVFKFAGRIIVDSIAKVLEGTDYTLEDIKYIVPHQANLRIIDYAAKKLGLKENKFYVNIHDYANTSAASIAIALDEMVKDGLLNAGDKIIAVGFGGGLTWGAVLIEWQK